MPIIKKNASTRIALTELILQIFRANGDLLAAGNALSAEQGLTSSQWQVLGAIASASLSVSAIAKVMGLTRQSVQRTADILVRDGLCHYVENPQHKVAMLLQLTGEGAEKWQAMTRLQKKWAGKLAENFHAKELATASAVVGLLIDILQESET